MLYRDGCVRRVMHRLAERAARTVQPKSKVWEAQILRQLDDAATRWRFPGLSTDENRARAGVRLRAFRAEEEWLVVLELPSYVGGLGGYLYEIYAYGNRSGTCVYATEFLDPSPTEGVGSTLDWIPNLFDFGVMLHGVSRHFAPDRADYEKAGINVEEPISDDLGFDRPLQVLRLLVSLVPEEVFLSECQVLERLGRPKGLPLFLQANGWHQPDGAVGEMPSDSASFRSLASAIARGDPGLYECPEDMINTHWSCRPNYLKPA